MRLVPELMAQGAVDTLRKFGPPPEDDLVLPLAETVVALWPFAEWAAKQPCESPIPIGMIKEKPCGKCVSCQARNLVKEAQGKKG